MSMEIRLPNITASREAEQISQIKSYLIQLVHQLNWAFETLEKAVSEASASGEPSREISEKMFEELKSVLTRSERTMNAELETKYVSRMEFDALLARFDAMQQTGGE